MRRAPSCRSRSWASRPPSCAPMSTARTRHRPPGDAGGHRGAHHRAAARPMAADERSTPRFVEPDTEDNLQRHSSRTTGRTSCRSFCRRKTASRRCWRRRSHKPDEIVGNMQPTANRGLWEYTVEKVAVNAVMAGARPEYFPVILALAASERLGAEQQLELGRGDGRGQRPDPPRDRHELRRRRDGPLQSRQCDHRPRLWAAVAERAGRVGAGRDLHGLASATTTPTTTSPSPRTRSAARGSRSTCRRASSRKTAWSASSMAAAPRRSAWACARPIGASMCATCCSGSTPPRAPCFAARPASPRASSSSAAASTPRRS